ncbi:MAG: arylsulfatase A-like enzyme [Mariniblastus sp.]|jgi:arylsulfatase A-like enzyme
MPRISRQVISLLVALTILSTPFDKATATTPAQSASSSGEELSSRRADRVSDLQIDPLATKAAAKPRPNLILINLDDADVDLFADDILDEFLPSIQQLASEGLKLSNCHVVTPLCGPSRTCLLRGQYAHRTGVKTNVADGPLNNGFTGAYSVFRELGYEQEHLGVWMQRAGYRTMMIGKYLHGRVNPVGIPGWNDLHISFGGNYYATSSYSSRLPVDQRRRLTGKNEYRTVVEADEAVGMIQRHAKMNAQPNASDPAQPFFLYVAPLAPHKPAGKTAMLQKEYEQLGRSPGKAIRIRPTPDLNEPDVSDKPAHLQIPMHAHDVMESLHEEHRKRVVSMKSVDDMLGRIRQAVREAGVADNTYIFLTSDHGYQLGHNRMIAKKMPYHRNTLVPMYVAGPGVHHGESSHLLAQIDLVPTFLELAGGSAPVALDGKSWLPLLSDPSATSLGDFRNELLIQNWEEKSQAGNLIPASYASLRKPNQIYTEWSTGDREYYDLNQDPYQLQNEFSSLSTPQQDALSHQLHQLKQGVDQPLVTFACPDLISKNTIIEGLAEDDQAVTQVELLIFDPATERYWNGSQWAPEKSTTQAKLAFVGGLITDWAIQVDLSSIEHEGQITVSATAIDDAGGRSVAQTMELKVDAIEPEALLKLPSAGTTVASPITLFGTCSDNDRMRGIELMLERVETNQYWDGLQWTDAKTTFFKRVTRDRWHVTLEIPVGKYRASATAYDFAGNRDETPSLTEFTVE